RSDSSNIRAPRIFINSPRKFLHRLLTRAVPYQDLENFYTACLCARYRIKTSNGLYAACLRARRRAKTKTPAGFSARRGLESFALLFLQAVQSASCAVIIAIAIIRPTTMTLSISRLTRNPAWEPEAMRPSANLKRRLDIMFTF